jgi:hypothetical protein
VKSLPGRLYSLTRSPAAGVGGFLAPTQKSRAFNLEMEPYTEDTKPEREYTSDQDFSDLDAVYSYLRHWAMNVKLDPKPAMPPGVIRRFSDNVRGLLAIADSCGPQWGQRAREAILFLFEKERAERPQIAMVRHGLAIFDALGVDQIGSVRFNRELKQLDLPDAKWTQYRGASGLDYAHPIAMHEQAALLRKVGIHSILCRFPDGPRRGYKRGQFEEAHRSESGTEPWSVAVSRSLNPMFNECNECNRQNDPSPIHPLQPFQTLAPARRTATSGCERVQQKFVHSITSSVRASSETGTSRPSAFAVLRLMTSSYLSANCTGKLPGASPFSTRST